ncbi:hypothetical protein D3C86_1363690 [compost metagenome]
MRQHAEPILEQRERMFADAAVGVFVLRLNHLRFLQKRSLERIRAHALGCQSTCSRAHAIERPE